MYLPFYPKSFLPRNLTTASLRSPHMQVLAKSYPFRTVIQFSKSIERFISRFGGDVFHTPSLIPKLEGGKSCACFEKKLIVYSFLKFDRLLFFAEINIPPLSSLDKGVPKISLKIVNKPHCLQNIYYYSIIWTKNRPCMSYFNLPLTNRQNSPIIFKPLFWEIFDLFTNRLFMPSTYIQFSGVFRTIFADFRWKAWINVLSPPNIEQC